MPPSKKALIYLADLTHTGLRLATESFPINIGLVTAYAKKHLGDAIEVRLFKYPDALTRALKQRMPDILGCSNYVWNSNLSEWILGYAKRINPSVVTVQGGTNYPFRAEGQSEFLRQHPHTDFHIYYEGEVAFLNLVKRFLDTGLLDGMKTEPIAGCQFLSPENGNLVSGPPVDRLKALDEIPSPYASGLLDEFFDGQLTPMLETTRGCPFTCNFCNAGDHYYSKVNMFSLEYVKEELGYMAPRIAKAGVSHLTIADNNFGMYARDAEICRLIKQTQEQYGWPMGLICTTGKNNKERIIKATEILGSSLLVSMSVQSMDPDVLVNIKRSNIQLDTYKQINKALVQQGRSGMGEVIFPLPGETYDSFMRGVQSLIEAGANKIMSYTLQLLYGTDYKDSAYRQEHGYEGKWRVIPLDFGVYEGERVFDIEEVAVCSKYASFEDYLLIRGFALLTECLYNNFLFWEVLRYLNSYGVSPYAWLRTVWDRRASFPPAIRDIFDSFLAETRAELFDSEEALKQWYDTPENYARLLRGEIGGNVIFKHKVRLVTQQMKPWVDFITPIAAELVYAQTGTEPHDRRQQEMAELQRYLNHKLSGILEFLPGSEQPIVGRFQHDILGWLRHGTEQPLVEFREAEPVEYTFYFTRQQRIERADSARRYGTDPNGLAKILARVPSFERLFRHVETRENAAASIAPGAMPACS